MTNNLEHELYLVILDAQEELEQTQKYPPLMLASDRKYIAEKIFHYLVKEGLLNDL
jgi:hypothetical protein